MQDYQAAPQQAGRPRAAPEHDTGWSLRRAAGERPYPCPTTLNRQ
jgi:hypothetical protein